MLGVKIIISIVILCITSYMGIEMSSSLKSREEILTDMVTFLKLVQNEMKYMLSSLPNAFEISRQKLTSPLKDVIGAIVVDMEKYGAEKVDTSIDMNVATLEEMTVYDRQIITSTFKNLGRSDIEAQTNIIANAIEILNKQIKEANEFKIKNSKVYKTVGTISGLLIVVIFI